MNYYERHIGDYLKDTAHLSLLEHGIYARLLDVYYTRERGVPDATIARLIGARTKDEVAALRCVLAEFFVQEPGGVWTQPRCEREIERYQRKAAILRDLQERDEYRKYRDFVLDRDNHACRYCGATDRPLQLDHVVARSRGGSDDPSNLAAACRPCNASKGAKDVLTWLRTKRVHEDVIA